jgi:hypothetical protein
MEDSEQQWKIVEGYGEQRTTVEDSGGIWRIVMSSAGG